MPESHVDVYAHWLDGEFFNRRCIGALDIRKKRVEGLLKLHFLFGNRICISDVQLADSRMVLELFQDSEFCEFVRENPSAFRLVTAPSSDMKHASTKLACVLSGLLRSLEPGWLTSAFSTPEISMGVAKRLSAESHEDAARALVVEDGPLRDIPVPNEDKQLYTGLMNALEHFLKGGEAVTPYVPRDPSTYYDILEKAQAKAESKIGDSRLRGNTLKELNSLIHFLGKGKQRYRRSLAIQQLDWNNPEHIRHYSYILQA